MSTRIELRLREAMPQESEVIGVLQSYSGIYGKKTEFIRDCLRRGYNALCKEADRLLQEGKNESELIDHMTNFSGADYRLMKLFLDNRIGLDRRNEKEKVQKLVEETVSSQDSAVLVKPSIAPEPAVHEAINSIRETTSESKIEATDTKSGTARHDWSKMRAIAGSQG